jgi:hypothetical protein
LEKEKITGGCPRIEAVARKCWFESDFFIIWGEYRVYLTKIMGKSGRIQLFRSRFVFSHSLLSRPCRRYACLGFLVIALFNGNTDDFTRKSPVTT